MHDYRLFSAALLLSGLAPIQAQEIAPLIVTASRTAQTADSSLAAVTGIDREQIMQHVVITGRAAKPELIELADTVSEMREVKHAFKAGIRAQKGVEL